MSAPKITSIYICHWSLNDPLCQSQALGYLRPLAERGYRFALITFEQHPYRMNMSDSERARLSLASEGIFWYPVAYHQRPPLIAKAYDCVCAITTALKIVRRHSPRIIHTRGTSSVAIALTIKLLTNIKFLYDADSSLAEEYTDTGYWSRNSIAFRLADAFEAVARRYADGIIVLTERMRRRFVDRHCVTAPIDVIPCCIATERMRFDPVGREQRRRDIGASDSDTVLIYVGKAGWRYETNAMLGFVSAVRTQISGTKLVVLTPDDPELFQDAARSHGVPASDMRVERCLPADVPGWLSAADAGLAFIRSLPCETGSSPVKIGEYLAAGLPVVITPDIGDYSQLIEVQRLGVVVRGRDGEDLAAAASELRQLWNAAQTVRERCRLAANLHVSVATVGVPRYATMYEHLGCEPVRAAAIA